mmetsp:Transcript_114222/g.271898  ORF Transcript_114222/g.271898 Transcript_114222/m.271898 type:complete len:226 (-) Transcript_114222:1190-1867(-)
MMRGHGTCGEPGGQREQRHGAFILASRCFALVLLGTGRHAGRITTFAPTAEALDELLGSVDSLGAAEAAWRQVLDVHLRSQVLRQLGDGESATSQPYRCRRLRFGERRRHRLVLHLFPAIHWRMLAAGGNTFLHVRLGSIVRISVIILAPWQRVAIGRSWRTAVVLRDVPRSAGHVVVVHRVGVAGAHSEIGGLLRGVLIITLLEVQLRHQTGIPSTINIGNARS